MSAEKKRPRKWSEQEVLTLIDLYQAEDVLYDAKSPLYKNKSARIKSLRNIAFNMQLVPAVTVDDVKKKLGNLRGQFTAELIKLRKNNKTDWEPPYWFNRLQFLEDHLRKRESSSNVSFEFSDDSMSEDLIYAQPASKRARTTESENAIEEESVVLRRNDLLGKALEALDKSESKYSESVDSFGEYMKSQLAFIPAELQPAMFQKLMNTLFEYSNNCTQQQQAESVKLEYQELQTELPDAAPITSTRYDTTVPPIRHRRTADSIKSQNSTFGHYVEMFLDNISDADTAARAKLQIKVLLSKAIMEEAESQLLAAEQLH